MWLAYVFQVMARIIQTLTFYDFLTLIKSKIGVKMAMAS